MSDETSVVETPLDLAPHTPLRVRLIAAFCRLIVRGYTRLTIERAFNLPDGPAILAFNHLSWFDPFVVLAAHPHEPRLYLFGPRELRMDAGVRNKVIRWTKIAVPFRPDRRDLVAAVRKVESIAAAGGHLAIAGEGRISVGERRVEPLSGGIATFARRSGAPVVPMAINGTSWFAFRWPVRVRYGAPLTIAEGERDADFLERVRQAFLLLVADWPDREPPRFPFGRFMSELFNDWPGGTGRPAQIPADDGRPVAYVPVAPAEGGDQ